MPAELICTSRENNDSNNKDNRGEKPRASQQTDPSRLCVCIPKVTIWLTDTV